MIPAPSNYLHKANQTFFWDNTDSQEQYQRHLQDPEALKILHNHGLVDYEISYTFNSHGFRTAEFDHDIDIVCFGCSMTMGTGVRQEHTWPAQLAAATGLRTANLGHAGSSNDTAYRMAQHYLPFLKPKYAVWLQTDRHRLELIDESINTVFNLVSTGTGNMYSNNAFVKTWWSSSINQELNLQKNTQAFLYLCNSLSIKPVILPREELMITDLARDLSHSGPDGYRRLVVKIKSLL